VRMVMSMVSELLTKKCKHRKPAT